MYLTHHAKLPKFFMAMTYVILITIVHDLYVILVTVVHDLCNFHYNGP